MKKRFFLIFVSVLFFCAAPTLLCSCGESGAGRGNGGPELSAGDFSERLVSSEELEAKCGLAFTIPRPSGRIRNVSGGCLAGKYFYQAFFLRDRAGNERGNVVRIVKYDTQAKKTVRISGNLALNHVNDLTYNKKLGLLVAAHNNPFRRKVSFVDPETLEVTETREIGYPIYCLSYDEKTDGYFVGISGGQSFLLLDSEFKSVSETFRPTGRTEGYITQGCCSDENHVYFVLHRENVVTVYDREGRFVTLIRLKGVRGEPENISVSDGRLYVSCASRSAEVYAVTPV